MVPHLSRFYHLALLLISRPSLWINAQVVCGHHWLRCEVSTAVWPPPSNSVGRSWWSISPAMFSLTNDLTAASQWEERGDKFRSNKCQARLPHVLVNVVWSLPFSLSFHWHFRHTWTEVAGIEMTVTLQNEKSHSNLVGEVFAGPDLSPRNNLWLK